MALVALTFVAGMRIYQVRIGEMRARRIPVLCAVAIGAGHVPGRLPVFAWVFLFLRVVHSAIQCTTTRSCRGSRCSWPAFSPVMAMWAAYAVSYLRA